MSPETLVTAQATISDAAIQAILQALDGLRYGQVTVIVQDGRVMQVDRTDRYRLPPLDLVPLGQESQAGVPKH